jgi:orotidine-5'-phosphate decarboxylase
MTLPFQKRFAALAAERSALCVGIDPSSESLNGWGLADDLPGLRGFCERMVEACAPLTAIVKPQAAFFERHGPAGMEVLRQTVEGIKSHGALVIIDGKRGDIGSTAVAYGDAFLGPRSPFGGDALTLSAYLGLGSLAPIFDIARREGPGFLSWCAPPTQKDRRCSRRDCRMAARWPSTSPMTSPRETWPRNRAGPA